jgi:hypothetical protein
MLNLMSTTTLSQTLVRDVVRSARSAGLSDVLIGVLADPSQPEVARLRAYGRLTAALDRPIPTLRSVA